VFEKVTGRMAVHAVRHPDKIFLIDLHSGRAFSFGEFDSLVNRTCRYLENLGARPGDIVSTVLENSVEFCLLYFAALRSNIVLSPFPAFFSAWDILRDTEFIRPKFVFLPEARRDEFRSAGEQKSALQTIPSDGFFETLQTFPPDFPEIAASPLHFACLYQTAGRRADPRGVLYSHGNMFTLIPSVIRGFRLSAKDVHLIVLPLAHTAALNYSLLPAAWLGATVVLARDFWPDRERFWEIVRNYGVNYVEVVPTILHVLLHQKARPGRLESLPFMPCGSAPLSPDIRTEFDREFGLPVADLYGLTETGPTHADAVWSPGWKKGTIGKPLDCNEIRVLDKDGRRCPVGESGEIAIRGNNVFPAYAINPELRSAHFRDDWFLTGDLGIEDADGYFHFSGRKKELIIRGGMNVHPGEIDEVFQTHPDVLRSATRGTPDDFFGELIRAKITLRPGSAATESSLKEYCRRYLSPIKVPDIITL